jgi:hypothetical protein
MGGATTLTLGGGAYMMVASLADLLPPHRPDLLKKNKTIIRVKMATETLAAMTATLMISIGYK